MKRVSLQEALDLQTALYLGVWNNNVRTIYTVTSVGENDAFVNFTVAEMGSVWMVRCVNSRQCSETDLVHAPEATPEEVKEWLDGNPL